MTKQELKLMSMLNYYEIDLSGTKDEKMSKKDLQRYLDRFNQALDYYMLQDIIQKIKEGKQPPKEEDGFDDNLGDLDDDDDEEEEGLKKFEDKKNNKKEIYSNNNLMDIDINNFIKWLTIVLYTGNYSVIVTDENNSLNIKLIRLDSNNNKGKK
jgi:hypothetical protein